MISVAEALGHVLALGSPLGTEEVDLAEAAGRILASPVISQRDQPPFAASAMDGYAIQTGDATPGRELAVIGEAAAGDGFAGHVAPGTAVRIFTGAPVPRGADRILIQEDAERYGARVIVGADLDAGPYIRPAGGDFRMGEEIPAPRRLSPADIALAAAMNCPRVTVRRRPRVALIPTGDELVLPGREPGPDQIVSSNNFGLAAMLQEAGATPLLLPIARDTPESLRAAFAEAAGADLIVTLGGASVGDHDLVQETAVADGLTLSFYKIAMRPGKPLMAGTLGGVPMLGLPGNPVSSMVCAQVFILPLIDHLLGMPHDDGMFDAPLAHPQPAGGPRAHYMRARRREDGLHVFSRQDSSLLSVLAEADCLAILPPHAPAQPAGARLNCLPLGARK